MSAPSLVIFDCDGVLVDSETLSALAYRRVYEKHGMPGVGPEIIARCIGMKQPDIIARVQQLTGHLLPEDRHGDLWIEMKTMIVEELQPTAGIVPFLDALRVPRCVASSSSVERIQLSLETAGIASYFGGAVYSTSMVARGKPAPDIFLFAAEAAGAEPSGCVVIEDSPFGIQGAVAAGMTAIGYTGGSHTGPGHGDMLKENGAHLVCADWSEVAHELERRGA